MDAILSDLLISIISSVIYDSSKSFLFSRRFFGNNRESITTFVETRVQSEFSFIDDPSSILNYLRLPQVTGIIEGYAFYKLTGELSEKLRVKLKVSHNTLTQEDIIKHLADGYGLLHKDSIHKESKLHIEQLLNSIVKISMEFYLSQLDSPDKFRIFLINDHSDKNVELLTHYMDRQAEYILNSLKFDFIHPHIDISSTKKKYDKIMRDKLSRAHIYLLDYFDFSKFYVHPRLSGMEFDKFVEFYVDEIYSNLPNTQSAEAWKYIFDENRIVYIVGGAGYGKSLFLRNIALNFCEMNLLGHQERLVIHGDLKNFVDQNGNTKPVMQFLQDSLVAASGMNYNDFSEEFMKYYLDSGSCIILLDALDEVREEKRNDIHATVRSYFKNSNPNNKICITSRSRGFIRMHEETVVLYIQPLTYSQIDKYIDNIIALGKFSATDKADFMIRTKPLIEKGFLNSCLILSLLVNIYKAERALPDNKLDLYQKCFEYISYKREIEEKKSLGYNWDRVYPLMNEDTFTRLAQACAPNNQEVEGVKVKDILIESNIRTFETKAAATNAVSEFLKFCANRTELFVPGATEDSFKFFHRSFLDYFYALHIYKYMDSAEGIYEELCRFNLDSEIFELLLSLLKNRKRKVYDNLIDHVFIEARKDLESENPSFYAINMLILFMQEITERIYGKQLMDIVISNSKKIVRAGIGKINTEDGRDCVVDSNGVIYHILSSNKKDNKQLINIFKDTYRNSAINELAMTANMLQIRMDNKLPKKRVTVGLIHWLYFVLGKLSFYTVAYVKLNGLKHLFDELRYINDASRFPNISKSSRQDMFQIMKLFTSLSKEDKQLLYQELEKHSFN